MPQPDHIVRIPLPEPSDWDEETGAYFAKCEEKLGLIPNVLRAYTARLAKFQTFTRFYNELCWASRDCRSWSAR